jgi:hypothetical protein
VSDRFYVHIHIGGTISTELAKELVTRINDECLHFACGPELDEISLEDLENEAEKHDGNLMLYDFERPGGDLTNLCQWLQENEVPYDQHCEAKYEYDADVSMYRPGMVNEKVFFSIQTDCDPLVRREDVLKVYDILKIAFNEDTNESYYRATTKSINILKDLCVPEIGPLPPFKIED